MNNFKAGIFKQQLEYKSFLPSHINRNFEINDKEILLLLEEASLYLGRLEAYSQLVPDIDLFIQMHIYKEATLSSKIEGTQATMDEAVSPEKLVMPEKKDDWSEIQNYIEAINFAKQQLTNLPISTRLITNIHAILLQGVRGEHKNPGEIRRSQNWIGGSSLKDAFFIPPHFEDLSDLLSDLEAFWHNKNIQIPILVKIAIFHYQFETLHPFCDGNGRIGRLLIPLMLISENILSLPSLYISSFFEKHKGSYYDSLTVVRASNNINQWIKFFLSGIIYTAKSGTTTLKNVVEFKKNLDHKIISLGARAKLAEELIRLLFTNPITNTQLVSKNLNITYGKASRLIKELVLLGILKEKIEVEKVQYFQLNGYLDLFN